MDNNGTPVELLFVDNFTSTLRPWYIQAVQARKPIWTSIYQLSLTPGKSLARVNTIVFGMSSVAPIFDSNGAVTVVGTELVLSDIAEFLGVSDSYRLKI